MLVVKCMDKQRDNKGKIINYTVQDQTGHVAVIGPAILKKNIAEGALDVINLTLTSDGRLIDKSEADKKYNSKEEKEKYMQLVADKTVEFIIPILKKFEDATKEDMEITNIEGKTVGVRNSAKTMEKIKELIKREELRAIRIVIYSYEEHLSGGEDDYDDGDYSDDYEAEEQEKYLKSLYGSYDENGYSSRAEYDEGQTSGSKSAYEAKMKVQESTDQIKNYIANFEKANNCKVLSKLSNVNQEGELALTFRGFQ